MPVEMERALKREAKKKGLTGRHAAAYVYGTMRKTGWVPSTQKKRKPKVKKRKPAGKKKKPAKKPTKAKKKTTPRY